MCACVQVLDGKGGGKAGVAQGQATAVAKVGDAVAVAQQYAKERL